MVPIHDALNQHNHWLEDICIVCDNFTDDSYEPVDPIEGEKQQQQQQRPVAAVLRPAAVQALVAGSCRSSLQRVVLVQSAQCNGAADGIMVGVLELAVLLRANLSSLREVAMDVNMSVTLPAASWWQQQERLAQLRG